MTSAVPGPRPSALLMLQRLDTTMRTIALTILVGGIFVSWQRVPEPRETGAPLRPSEATSRRAGEQQRPAGGGTATLDPVDSALPAAGETAPIDATTELSAVSAPDPDPPLLGFPLSQPLAVTDSFGDPRPGGRSHEGVDLMAPKRTPVHAAAAGSVRWTHDEAGGRCCAVELLHVGGWRTRYLHLDNDTPGTDDGLAVGIAPGVEPGARVEAGELIGWVGDSGNAEEVGSHLHFELRDPAGRAINATALLQEAAERRRRELVGDGEAAAQ